MRESRAVRADVVHVGWTVACRKRSTSSTGRTCAAYGLLLRLSPKVAMNPLNVKSDKNVYKVGMTRRLEPMERVYELGDASVPFPFDVHAMIYSDNAPALETMLHGYLSHKRLNMVNPRKEFFHVNLEDLEAFVKGKGLKIEFTKLAEAEEYRKTVAFRQEQEAKSLPEPDQFPFDLFATTTG